MAATKERWEFWIDVGGTFTDAFARHPDGSLERAKVLSSGRVKGRAGEGSSTRRIVDEARSGDPGDFWKGYKLELLDDQGNPVAEGRVVHSEGSALALEKALAAAPEPGQTYELSAGEEAPILAVRHLLGLPLAEPLPPLAMRLGTTRGTNALITRTGAETAFVTTRGFGDVLEIGYQNRPRLFELAIEKREPLHRATVEVDERLDTAGEVLREVDAEALRRDLETLRGEGIESLAICLLNAYRDGRHEERAAEIAREAGFEEISVSSRVAPLIKIVARGDTTVMDAYLNPVLRTYVERLRAALGEGAELRILTSAGGLVGADRFVGKESILSGPAGGVVGFSHVARAAGFERAIGFDMGGTSTDVSRWDGRYELEYETEKAGVRVVSPMMAIETVAAGGGSICGFDGVKLTVGPASAGADPGPACYGRGGPLAVTDLNVYLGKILPEHFPFPLDRGAIERRLDEIAQEIEKSGGQRLDRAELAEGFLRVANAAMVKAIGSVSMAKGRDPRDYVMAAFGGAAPQHACAVARELGISEVLNHPDSGILSAYGLGMADVVRHRAEGVYRPYGESAVKSLEKTFERLGQEARGEIEAEGVPAGRIEIRPSLDLRYRGLDAFLNVPEPEDGDYARAYTDEHRQLYGYTHVDRELEIVAARVEAVGHSPTRPEPARRAPRREPEPAGTTRARFDGEEKETRVYRRTELEPGDRFSGPAIVLEKVSTTVVDPGWEAELLSDGQLLLRDLEGAAKEKLSLEMDPVMLEVFNHQFAGIAEQMGITLRNTSSSVNVKERLDFSCAIFTPTGGLVVNAPHMPVHLGAMAETVKRVIADNPDLGPGDVFLTNDPYRGGSHLPDLTVVTPVHGQDDRLLFFTASRAHHAEIGGITPGSMPPFSKNLAEEGVLIRNFSLVARGRSRMKELEELLLGAPYPTRAVADNLADVAAQVAANRQGASDLEALVERYGADVVEAYMGHIQAAAERKMRAALARLDDRAYRFADHLDDGSKIQVEIAIEGEEAAIDFAGTSPVLEGNLNANRAIVTAAVMYVMRCLIDEDIPLNQGVLAPLEIEVPESLLAPPERESPEDSAAVVGGNVETSQRVTDVLLGALGLAAASQGTMNNLLFGDATFGYYETICGGAGATPEAPGASAVHTHMTNTRLTDPEVLEQRYPVRVQEFAIRQGSGGQGRHPGGDGVIRHLEFLKPLELSILSQRRGPYPPYGLEGGGPGALGRNTLIRRNGREEELEGRAQVEVEAGDAIRIETPGGGGWGEA